ncbi:GAF domain-containing protein [Mucilaginibacter antarcticus]|uniref:histidine kinase n=1 Tax=Mucilaginibacter antarcticus TaxID=1855725 RepID=A0ABW5XV58_9SPHI
MKPEEIYDLLQSIDGIVWEADILKRQTTFVSQQLLPVLGFSSTAWIGNGLFWETHSHNDDRQITAGYDKLLSGEVKSQSFEYRIVKADGHIAWIRDSVSVVYDKDRPVMLRGIIQDITITKRLIAMERLESDILRLNSDLNITLDIVLTTYLQGLEDFFPKMLSCIHKIKNGRLANGVAPSLPPAYMEAMEGIPIGENEGSCGVAAATKQQIIVGDITTDPRWEKYRETALKYNLKACWSNPVINADGDVMATVSMYYREARLPTGEELQVMDRATALLRIILENRQKTDIINDAHIMMLQSQELANFGNWRWDVQHDIVSWSPALYAIYGLDAKDFKATFAGYQERLHPEDRERVYHQIEGVLKSKIGTEFEERIIRPNGEVRYLRSWARLKQDEAGIPLEMIGACLDITEEVARLEAIALQTGQLQEIAWVQSHVIRSPLTRIIALIDLIKDPGADDTEKEQLLDHLLTSAQELDEQIKRIGEGNKD